MTGIPSNPNGAPQATPDDEDEPATDSWVEALVDGLSLPQKIAQMTQASNEAIEPERAAELELGSVLSGGNGAPEPNTVKAWADMVSDFTGAGGKTPLLYGVDAVHGHALVAGATVFPHNIGLGAAGDVDLVERIGRVTATELRATGIRWNFAPTVAVPGDIRWGRTYEGFSRDPAVVGALGAAFIRGLQTGAADRRGVLACAKHYAGDGGTVWGSVTTPEWVRWWDGWGSDWRIDQGDTRLDEAAFRAIHLRPYVDAIDAGVMTVMASYSAWNGIKLHGHRRLLTDVLKGELGFSGFVVSDWMGIDQIAPSYEDCVVRAVNAGIDMVMVPIDYERFLSAMSAATADGRIPLPRIDDAVRRIVWAKAAIGLFEPEDTRPPLSAVGSSEHRALAAEAVRAGAVLLKDDGGLPLRTGAQPIGVAGAAADDVGLQCGGWTTTWQGSAGPTTTGSTLLDGLRTVPGLEVTFAADGDFGTGIGTGIVCLAEEPYAEGPGDTPLPTVSEDQRKVFHRIRAAVDRLILVLYSGRPLVIPDLIDRADSVVVAWLPGSEAAALATLLTGEHPFRGTLPQPWPAAAEELNGDRPHEYEDV